MNAAMTFVSVNFHRGRKNPRATRGYAGIVESFLLYVYATIERRLRNSRDIVWQFVLRAGTKREPRRNV